MPPSRSMSGYAVPGTGSHPLLLVDIQGVLRGGWSKTLGLQHSVNVSGPV